MVAGPVSVLAGFVGGVAGGAAVSAGVLVVMARARRRKMAEARVRFDSIMGRR